jgi:hypothetical protein
MDFLWLRTKEMKIGDGGENVFLAILRPYVMLCLPNDNDLCKHISQGRYIPCICIYLYFCIVFLLERRASMKHFRFTSVS